MGSKKCREEVGVKPKAEPGVLSLWAKADQESLGTERNKEGLSLEPLAVTRQFYLSLVSKPVCLKVTIAVMRHHTQGPWEGKGLFGLTFHITADH